MTSLAQVDMALDEIIMKTKNSKSKQQFRRRTNGTSRPGARFQQRRRNLPYKWKRDKLAPTDNQGGSHILVSNLSFLVTDEDIRELFSEFGAIKKCFVNYDKSGRSHGSAEVLFLKKEDALSAVRKYNNVALDGRPMRVEMVSRPKTQLSSRLGPISKKPGINKRGIYNRGSRFQRQVGKFRGAVKSNKPPQTKETLDAELEAYRRAAEKSE